MPNIGGWPSDSSNLVASQFASKNYHTGELSGARLVLSQGMRFYLLWWHAGDQNNSRVK